MGCDIHDLVQVKADGKWKTVVLDPCGSPRNYDTFAMLAGVRNGDIKPIALPRGLPDDLVQICDEDNYIPIDDLVDKRKAYIGNDGHFWLGDHTHSWLLLSEMKKYKIPNVMHHYLDDLIKELERIANDNEAPYSEVRYVFGFDN
jgi:hypothetical protein